jgi:hypothetical protein
MMATEAPPTKDYKRAFVLGFLLQLPVGAVFSTFLDGGFSANLWGMSMTAFWTAAPIDASRAPAKVGNSIIDLGLLSRNGGYIGNCDHMLDHPSTMNQENMRHLPPPRLGPAAVAD